MLIAVVLKPRTLCYNVASAIEVKLICRDAFGRASAGQSEFRDAAETKHDWKKNAFHCLLIFGQAHRSPVLDSDARAVVRRSSSDVRGAPSLRPTHLTLWRIFTRRCCACLALLALTLQFGMSFGHIHAPDFTGQGIYRSTADAAHAWHGPMKRQSAARLPAKLADDDEDCPICFSGFLLATSFIPDAAQASPSLDLKHAGHPFAFTFDGVLKTHRAPFQSRAPPLG
jgi:hypothetical protein